MIKSLKEKIMDIKARWKKALNTDNIIDFSVDVGLIALMYFLSYSYCCTYNNSTLKFVNKHLKRFA